MKAHAILLGLIIKSYPAVFRVTQKTLNKKEQMNFWNGHLFIDHALSINTSDLALKSYVIVFVIKKYAIQMTQSKPELRGGVHFHCSLPCEYIPRIAKDEQRRVAQPSLINSKARLKAELPFLMLNCILLMQKHRYSISRDPISKRLKMCLFPATHAAPRPRQLAIAPRA